MDTTEKVRDNTLTLLETALSLIEEGFDLIGEDKEEEDTDIVDVKGLRVVTADGTQYLLTLTRV